jgi:superfamily II DNA helicase RecQ
MLFESALSYVIDIFKDETVKAVTEEQKKAIFSLLSGRDTLVCIQTGYGKSLIYHVAPQKPV